MTTHPHPLLLPGSRAPPLGHTNGAALLKGCRENYPQLPPGPSCQVSHQSAQRAENSHHSRQPGAWEKLPTAHSSWGPRQRHSVTHEGGTSRSRQGKPALGPSLGLCTWSHSGPWAVSSPDAVPPYNPASPTLRPALTPEKALRVCRGLAGHKSWTAGSFHLSRVGRVGEGGGGGGELS